MKKLICSLLILPLLMSCLDEFLAEGIQETRNILVVEGTITDGESFIHLSNSVSILDTLTGDEAISNARMNVECSDGTFFEAQYEGNGTYSIINGELNPELCYRLNFSIGSEEYQSTYLTPIHTPEIDSISFQKAGRGQPISVHVSTHTTENAPSYFRWSYKENWEVRAQLYANAGYIDGQLMLFDLRTPYNTYYCWGKDSSKVLLLGSTKKLAESKIPQQKLYEIPCDHDKISQVYHVEVTQTQLHEEAYIYFKRLQEEIERTGGIFSTVLSSSEDNGNIYCMTDPGRPVIGFVEVASITRKAIYHYMRDHNYYEAPLQECPKLPYDFNQDLAWVDYISDFKQVSYWPCVDCRKRYNATKQKPAWWPTEHL